MTAVPAGMLIHRLAFERATTTVDGLGAPTRTWVPVKTVWGSITPITARHLVVAQRLSAEITHQITVRYQATFADVRDLSNYRASHSCQRQTKTDTHTPGIGNGILIPRRVVLFG